MKKLKFNVKLKLTSIVKSIDYENKIPSFTRPEI
jgi:hypothetical protein